MVKISKYSNTVEYALKTTLDSSGIDKLRSELINVKTTLIELNSKNIINKSQMDEATASVEKFQKALSNSYNSRIGLLDTKKLSSELSASNLDLVTLQRSLSTAGTTGSNAFNSILANVTKFGNGVKKTSDMTDKLFNTFQNTVRWGITSSVFNNMTNSLSEAVDYVKELDSSLTQIMMVTDYSREQMNEYAKSANDAAKALGSTTTAMTNASLIFAQQGFNINTSDQLAQLSTKLANASGQSTSDTSDQITAYMNAYGISGDIEKVQKAMDSWANVANISAADVGELAQASQKVASTAATVGVSMDQLNGQIAAIESVTREGPEQIGNGLKTLYARFSDLKAGDTLDDGVSLGTVTKQLQQFGVDVLDADGKMRNVGDIMENLMSVWGNLDTTQKAAAAQSLAGKYQMARFEALMNGSDLYKQYKAGSEDANGTLDIMNEKYLDSIEGKANQIQSTFEGIVNSLFNTDSIYPFMDALKEVLQLLNDFVDAIGGGGTALTALGVIATKVFNKNLSAGIANSIQNIQMSKMVKNSDENFINFMNSQGFDSTQETNENTLVYNSAKLRYDKGSVMTREQQQEFDKMVDNNVNIQNARNSRYAENENTAFFANVAARAHEDELGTRSLVDYNRINGTLDVKGFKELALENYARLNGKNKDSIFSDNAMSDYLTKINNLNSNADKYLNSGVLSQLSKLNNGSSDKASMEKTLKSAVAKYTELKKTLPNNSEEFRNIAEAISEFNSAIDDLNSEDKDYTTSIKKATESAREASQGLQDRMSSFNPEQINLSRSGLESINSDTLSINSQMEDAKQGLASFKDMLGKQESIEAIMQTTSAVGDLAVAWQSFQNLGSLWSNDDLSTGEKLEQTIMNLSLTIPSLVSGIKSLKNSRDTIIKLFDEGSSALSKYSEAALSSTSIMSKFISKEEVLGGAASVGASGLSKLGSAFKALTSASGIAAIAITAAIALINKFNNNRIDKEALNSMDDYTKAYNKSQVDTSGFDEAYAQYKKTGEASDELISSSKELVDSLDIAGGSALIQSGNFDKLAESISNSSEEAKKQSQVMAQRALAKQKDKADELLNFDESFYPTAISGTLDRLINPVAAEFESKYGDLSGSMPERVGSLTTAESDYQQKIAELSEKRTEYDGKTDPYSKADVEEIDKQISNYQSMLDRVQKVLGNMSDTTELLQQQSDAFLNDESNAGKLDELKGLSEEDAKSKLESDSSYEPLLQQFQALGGELGSEASKEFLAGLTGSSTSDEVKKATETVDSLDINGHQKNMLKGMLSDEDLVNLTAKLDPETIANNINEILTQLNNGDSIDEIAVKFKPVDENGNDLTENSNSYDTDKQKSIFKELGLDYDKDFQTYKDGILSSNQELANSFNKQTSAIEAQRKSLIALSRDTTKSTAVRESAEKEANKLADQEKELEEQQNSIITKMVESQKGAKELSKSWDSNVKALKDENKGTAEYAEALDSVSTGFGHLMNIDMSTWSAQMKSDFFSNQKNMDDLKLAIDGDADALERLREAAAQQVLIQLKAEGLSEDDFNMLSSEMQDFQNRLGSIDVGADVDADPFVQKLKYMYQTGQLTAEQITKILSACGVDVDYSTVEIPSVSYVTGNTKARTLTTALHDPERGNGINPAEQVTTNDLIAKISKEKVDIPTFNAKKSTSNNWTGANNSKSKSPSGGSGGSGGSSYTPKTKDKQEDEADRYEKVNTQLEKIGNQYSRINKEQDRLTGDKLIKNMEKQIELLNKQIALYQEKQKIQQQEAQELRDDLSSNFGVTFDSDGYIANYMAVHDQLLDNINSLIDRYNATTDESGQEDLEKQIEEAQKKLDKFNDKYQRYDTLWSSDLEDTIQQIEDLKDSIEDLQIAAFNKSVEAADNIKDINDALAEFNKNMSRKSIKENPFDELVYSAKQLDKYFDDDVADGYFDNLISRYQELSDAATDANTKAYYASKIDEANNAKAAQGNGTVEAGGTGYLDMALTNANEIMDQIKQFEETGYSSIFGEDSADMYEAAKTVFDQMTGFVNDLWDDIENTHDKLMNCIDDIADRIEKRMQKFSDINDQLEHMQNISQMIHGDNAYDEQNNILAAQQLNMQAQLDTLTQTKAMWEDTIKSMEEGSEEYDNVQEKIRDTQSQINELVENSIENLKKQYENTVHKITDTWAKNNMGTDLDWLSTEWELINRNADQYLDSINKSYNIQKLQSKYLDLLDGSNDLAIQNKITDQMNQQLKYLRDKTKLSQYDVEYANAQLEILQKQIALEEAQRNKSQMKLRRDSQGNYSYVYSANDDNVRSAQSDLLDAQNNAYNLSKDEIKNVQDDTLSQMQQAFQTVNDIWTNTSLTVEEKKARMEEVISSLNEYVKGNAEKISTAEKNLINDVIQSIEMFSDENKGELQDIYDQIVAGNTDALDKIDDRFKTSITDWLKNTDDFSASCDKMFSDLVDNASSFDSSVNDVASSVGDNFNDMSSSIQDCVDKTNDLTQSTSDFITQLKSDAGVIQDYENKISGLISKVSDANNAMRAYQQQANEMAEKVKTVQRENANLKAENDRLTNAYNEANGGSGSGGSGSGAGANSETALGIAQAIWTFGGSKSGWGNDPIRSSKLTKAYGSDFAREVQNTINRYAYSNDNKLVNYDSMKYSSYSLIGYRSGGYTGDWGSGEGNTAADNGKLAWLHQKELVLNQTDTQNILDAVNTIRGLSGLFASGAIQAFATSMTNAMGGISTLQNDAQDISQNVHITAEFPNASSTKEIEDAILGLNDRSIQYAFNSRV